MTLICINSVVVCGYLYYGIINHILRFSFRAATAVFMKSRTVVHNMLSSIVEHFPCVKGNYFELAK
jgi:hypothetical protein